MKIYAKTSQPDVIHCITDGVWFPTHQEHPAFVEMNALLSAGQAELRDYVPPTPTDKRRNAYNALGVTHGEMVVALWELVVEGDDTKAKALQAVRAKIKADNPKC